MNQKDLLRQIKPLSELTIRDNFMFTEVFRDRELLTELLRRILPGEHIPAQKIAVKEFTVDNGYRIRGVRFDIFSSGGNYLFDSEMQAKEHGKLFARSLIYVASLVLNSMETEPYLDVNGRVYVIFICAYDATKTGRRMEHYTLKNENGIDERKEINIIILNCPVDSDDHPEIRTFARYVMDGTNYENDPYIRKIESAVQSMKKDSKLEVAYMLWRYEMINEKNIAREEGLEEGRAEGRAEGREEGRTAGQETEENRGMIRMYDTLLAILGSGEKAVSAAAEAYQTTKEQVLAVLSRRNTLFPDSK